jgi:hypothetical protein
LNQILAAFTSSNDDGPSGARAYTVPTAPSDRLPVRVDRQFSLLEEPHSDYQAHASFTRAHGLTPPQGKSGDKLFIKLFGFSRSIYRFVR